MGKSQDQKKYSNFIKSFFIRNLMQKISKEMDKYGAKRILDVGCGEGYPDRFFLDNKSGLEILGVDSNREALVLAQKRNPEAKYLYGDVYDLKNVKNHFDIVLLGEVLEHLSDPNKALGNICSLAPKAIITVPYEPWFSLFSLLSGSYLKSFGRHPEHLSLWKRRTLKDLLIKEYSEVSVKVSFPWLIAVCKK